MTQTNSPLALPPGTTIQEYRLDRVLGIGSFGIVYAATGQYFGDTVAIKEFLPTDLATRVAGTSVAPLSSEKRQAYAWAKDRFLKEAKILWDIAQPNPHPNIVRVTRFLEENGTAYMVMDYEAGTSLAEILDRRKTLPQTEIEALLLPLLNGLQRVHAASIWHRDIKPDNILVRPDHSPVLIDFGAAHKEAPDTDRSMIAVYSPAYAAPEQVFGIAPQGPWTDIYSLGATIYRMIKGSPPTNATERLQDIPYRPLVTLSPPGYDTRFLSAIDAALAFKVEDRPQNIESWRPLFVGSQATITPVDTESTVLDKGHLAPEDRIPTIPHSSSDSRMAASPGRSQKAAKQHPMRRVRRAAVITAVALSVATTIGIGIWMYELRPFDSGAPTIIDSETVSSGPEEVGAPVPAAVQPEKVADAESIMIRVEAVIRGIDCATIAARTTDTLQVVLTGYLASSSDQQTLRSMVRETEGVTGVVDHTRVVGRPFCEITELLEKYRSPQSAHAGDIRIELQKDLFSEGDPFVVKTRASDAFDGYLYLDYVGTDSKAIHLLPSGPLLHTPVRAGQTVILGEEEGWRVSPPHGLNMLIAVHVRESLFESPRPEEESLDEYLPALVTALEKVTKENSVPSLFIALTVFSTQQ